MQKKLSNWLVRKETAINHLYDADRWLTTGEFLHRVPDDVKMTIHGLIEGWLEECDIEPDFRDGWRSMLYQFYKFAPDRLFGKASDILLETTLLEGGGFVDDFSEMGIYYFRKKRG